GFAEFTKFNELLIHRINELREKHSSAREKGKDDKTDKPAKGENEPEENREELRENDEQLKKYQNMRSGIEGKLGQSKNFYGLNQTSAWLEQQTGISRIMAVFTGVNLIRVLTELKLFIFWLIRKYLSNEQMVALAAI
ncbi:MAG: hypothetical protein WCJ01_07570, partial [Ignavibacteria bacterium]